MSETAGCVHPGRSLGTFDPHAVLQEKEQVVTARVGRMRFDFLARHSDLILQDGVKGTDIRVCTFHKVKRFGWFNECNHMQVTRCNKNYYIMQNDVFASTLNMIY
jgi:hypothetical protein